MRRGVKYAFLSLASILLLLEGSTGPAAAQEFSVTKASGHEQFDREVDAAALAAQNQAIAGLEALVRKRRNPREEPTLLAKLADFQQQKGAILFRIALGANGGKTPQSKGAPNLAAYHKTLNDSIQTLTTLIQKYPSSHEVGRAYFTRGKGYEELGKQKEATADYLYLVKHFPDREETSAAYMALAEFAIQANNHPLAIQHLTHIEKRPFDPYYPFALYKLAWSHYNLKQIDPALKFAETQISFYRERKKEAQAEEGSDITSDSALLENTLLDIPLFYFEGYETRNEDYALGKALDYFRKVETGPALGKMLVRFTKLIRSRGLDQELANWKTEILASESKRPEAMEILIIAYEHQLNKRRYPQMVETARDMAKLYQAGNRPDLFFKDSLAKAQKLVLDTAENLQGLILKNKGTQEARSLSLTLADLYDSFTRMTESKDPRIAQVHYNLAETLFAIQDFEGSTRHYRWVVENLDKKSAQGTNANLTDSALKAVAARYEVLREKKLIPETLSAVSLQQEKSGAPESHLKEWIAWVDELASSKVSSAAEIDHFVFEANRAIYSSGQIAAAVARMERFVREKPASKDSVPSASLILDTYIAGSDWEKTLATANGFRKVTQWPDSSFGQRLFDVASNAAYKLIEAKFNAKLFPEVIVAVDTFQKDFAKSERLADSLNLAGGAAMSLGQKEKASEYFSKLIATFSAGGKVSGIGTAVLARGQIAEEGYRFAQAASDYRLYFSLPSASQTLDETRAADLRRKTLMLLWLSGDAAALREALKQKSLCPDSMEGDCDRFAALAWLIAPEAKESDEIADLALEKARKGPAESRGVWAAVALNHAKDLAFRDRNLSLRIVSTQYKDLDPMVKIALLPHLAVSIPNAMKLNRIAMKDVAPLRAHERYITRRVEVIREMENATTKIMTLPWSRIQAEAMSETAGLYLDFARGLGALPAPKDLNAEELAAYDQTIRKLVIPFEEKGQELRSKAFELGSKFAIEEDSFNRIAEPFFAENPNQAKKLKGASNALAIPLLPLNLDSLALLDPAGQWKTEVKSKDKPVDLSEQLKTHWIQALKGSNWAQIAYFLQESRSRAKFSHTSIIGMRAVSLAAAGAQAEALSEIQDGKEKMDPAGKKVALKILSGHYQRSYAWKKQDELNAELAQIELEERKTGGNRQPATERVASKP